ncbi:mediator of RNA polymerase II transcription subunit 1 isoform X2 [Siniperca chuatsi]|nr:mediator of RNA polymerase II transcription subunit 1 isoform X2 [Siniperca chuatsi]XP_044031732.1 mediator of RNA polymerase II transcription subunit 1 isoform X2 [Siniperca chuatsi]XP_044031733.1 mediator of RNA polymerase II transcription subunit 1 isoform X2 [Siniperca chuatsi]
MKTKSIISELRLKFAEKTWNETFQLVRRCMDKTRDESKPCELLVRSLERLQEVFKVSSMNTMKSRLEVIAKHQGMGFHITEATCYLTADLFYLEVVLLPCGGVEEVKVAPHGASPVPCESLLHLLRSKNFAEFSMKLAGLFTQYNIAGDNEIKLKLFASLQCLGKDLQQISHLPRVPKDSDPQVDTVNNGRIGCLIAGKEDCPLTIQFYITPTDGMKTSDLSLVEEMTETVVQAAQVTVGVSDVTHKLQMASVIPQPPQLDPQGCPVLLPLSEGPYETLPACFLLRLQPAIPMMLSFVNKLSQITDVTIPDVDLQWAPLPKLLMSRSQSANSHAETLDEQDTIFTVPLPGGVMHSYVLPGAAWERGAVVDSIPFTHAAHVPALLELLRHQCAINTLLRSCITSRCARTGSVCDLHFEVLPESKTSFSVTFHRPDTDSLAVCEHSPQNRVLVNIYDAHQITCTLFGAGVGHPSMDDYLSDVMKRCMSIPVTLRALYSKLEEITSAPLSPSRPATTEAENDHLSPSSTTVTDTNSASTTFSQSAAVPEDGVSVSGSAYYAMSVAKSELLPEINTSPAVNLYPFTPVGVFSHWMTNNGQLSELI